MVLIKLNLFLFFGSSGGDCSLGVLHGTTHLCTTSVVLVVSSTGSGTVESPVSYYVYKTHPQIQKVTPFLNFTFFFCFID